MRSDEFLRPAAALRAKNVDIMLDAALGCLGLALLPTFIAGAALKAGSLVNVGIGEAAAPEFVYVAHPEGRCASAKLRALVDCMREASGDPPSWETLA